MKNEEDNRITFRPTEIIRKGLDELLESDRWMTRSALVREALRIGIKELKKILEEEKNE